jgi:NADP-dependent 3-hydroxy acid dehydrogenase YdfG
MENSPEDPVAVVTGASSGIGKAVAQSLAERGYDLVLVGRDEARLQETKSQVIPLMADHASPEVLVRRADLRDMSAINRVVDATRSAFDRVDVLVHSAGYISYGTLETASPDELDCHYETNVRAPYALTKAFLTDLVRDQGQIVFINSSIVDNVKGRTAQYGASKCALRGLADGLRDQVNPKGVRVVSIYPGRTATPMQAHVSEVEGKPYRPEMLLQPSDVAQCVTQALSMPRTAEITDIWLRPMRKSY